ncbi:hypothetical protein EXS71_02360 [Candidatus Uhrbacteria bacterium]|nr:hypothetical protein [Candidatus Uhrbacteria bacterium]
MKRCIFIVSLFIVPLLCGGSVLAMTSTNYIVNWDSLNQGGNDVGTSTSYSIRDTMGELASGTSTSANYKLTAGYRAQDSAEALSFVVKSQNNSTQVHYDALNISLTTVNVSSTAAFSVGDYIAVVQDQGFSEKVIVGRVTAIVGTVMTLDAPYGATGVMSTASSNNNDYVYQLSGSTAPFGSLTAGSENVYVTMSSVQTLSSSGYTVYIQGNQLLQNVGAQAITTVSDGAVSVGSEEYGASTTGTRAYLPDTDLGVTTTQRTIQTSNVASAKPADRVPIIYKLSITGSTASGAYSQTVFYTLTVNY